jgi:hypothetical protein
MSQSAQSTRKTTMVVNGCAKYGLTCIFEQMSKGLLRYSCGFPFPIPMLKAEQSAVVQQANVDVVSLRQAEINYFALFFSSFGTQAALIAGFIVNSVSQVPGTNILRMTKHTPR